MSLNNEPELIEPHNQIKLEKIKKIIEFDISNH